jgi:hypothetical protein
VVDLEAKSHFLSASRDQEDDIPHTRNNWACYDFKTRRIVLTHYAIRSDEDSRYHPLNSWLVETSADGKSGWKVADQEDKQLKGSGFVGTFAVAVGGECRFIRLVNISRTHGGDDGICLSE